MELVFYRFYLFDRFNIKGLRVQGTKEYKKYKAYKTIFDLPASTVYMLWLVTGGRCQIDY